MAAGGGGGDGKKADNSAAVFEARMGQKQALLIQEVLMDDKNNVLRYENRLKSFAKRWPNSAWGNDAKCTPETLARAGFYHTPEEESPDETICVVCLKQMEGWEPDDDPWALHNNPSCALMKLNKPNEADWTAKDYLTMDTERTIKLMRKAITQQIMEFVHRSEEIESALQRRREGVVELLQRQHQRDDSRTTSCTSTVTSTTGRKQKKGKTNKKK